jgi:TrpR family trp operon transcriptional repressor
MSWSITGITPPEGMCGPRLTKPLFFIKIGDVKDRGMKLYKLNEIARTLASIDDPQVIEDFMNSILTEKEVFDISSRWELVKYLDNGVPQRTVAADLGLSLCKITRGSKELHKNHSAFKKILDAFRKL